MFLIDYGQFKILADEHEKGYIYRDFAVWDDNNNMIIAKSFYSTLTDNSLSPSNDYKNIIQREYDSNGWSF